jgi:hypothetical protein
MLPGGNSVRRRARGWLARQRLPGDSFQLPARAAVAPPLAPPRHALDRGCGHGGYRHASNWALEGLRFFAGCHVSLLTRTYSARRSTKTSVVTIFRLSQKGKAVPFDITKTDFDRSVKSAIWQRFRPNVR